MRTIPINIFNEASLNRIETLTQNFDAKATNNIKRRTKINEKSCDKPLWRLCKKKWITEMLQYSVMPVYTGGWQTYIC